jgi:hypothetical protein
MRLIACLCMAAVLCGGCRSCKEGEPPPRTVETTAALEPVDAGTVEEPAAVLPEVDPASLGLESPDPGQSRVQHLAVMDTWSKLVNADLEGAREELEASLVANPGNLHLMITQADLMLREGRHDEAIEVIDTVLRAGYPEFARKLADMPSVESLERKSPEHWQRLSETREAIRQAWERAVSGPGAFLLVAPPYPGGNAGDPESERLNRGWVVFLDAGTGRFLPLTPRSIVAGFMLDRADRRLLALSWRSYQREERDQEDELVRPAILEGAALQGVDLTTFEIGRKVGLGQDVVEVRLQVRSGHVLAGVVRLDRESGEGVETTLELDLDAGGSSEAPKAPPGPMDLIVAYGEITPPEGQGMVVDADSLPDGWRCCAPGEGLRLCAVPASRKSVLSELKLGDESVAAGIGILQMDVL